ncbi:MAG: TlpA family protein disulfide reductase [Planctomycetota bacterium]|nr:MAG: TlpA family protein disulfide reductase [Planctomycetota bacterium]REJ90140.1 MAG: TlpA family protein disulfide reductase [Planctomycetota bacterium]REK30714.1 MAG: TlpA family protein disulfide reductase [Planctomycetota bacterium]REK33089.1 MAG: TlpA family protein disulfide reductase [Planctomycetota bacterium]
MRRVLVLAVVVLSGGLAGCGSGGQEGSADDEAAANGSSIDTEPDFGSSPLGPGATPPELAAEGWLNGDAPSESELAGKVVVVETWAYWCGPCASIAPELVQTYNDYKVRDVVFIGLTAEEVDRKAESELFLSRYDITWPNGYGAGATIDGLGVYGYPTTIVIGKDGKVVWNSMLPGTLREAIDEALAVESESAG